MLCDKVMHTQSVSTRANLVKTRHKIDRDSTSDKSPVAPDRSPVADTKSDHDPDLAVPTVPRLEDVPGQIFADARILVLVL